MSSSWTHRMPWRGAMLLAVLGLAPLSAGEPARSHVTRSERGESRRPLEISTYAEPGGETYLAVSVRLPELPQGEISRHDHVLLVDTSASQVGEHRQQALAVAKAFMDSLPDGHRVAVYAVDLQTQPLTEGFVPVRGAETQAALAKLDRRLPLGATNLSGALRRALADMEAGESSSILYIGDGMSAANLLPLDELKNLTQELKGRKVPVHSYAVGPQTDLQLLGSLALQTGGYVQYDMANARLDAPSRVGEELAQAVTAPIYFPESVAIEPAGLNVFPKSALPMRADRSTVYLAKGPLSGGVTVRVSGGGASQSLSVPPSDFEGGQTFLRNHFQQAEKTGGLSMAYAGNRLLRTAQSAFDNQVAAMVSAGERAITAHEFNKAEEIGLAVKNADPKNTGAQVLLLAARKGQARTRTVAFQNQPSLLDNPDVQKLGQPAPIDQTLPPSGPGTGLIPTVEQEIAIKTQRLTLEVNRAIEEANSLALTSPDEALETLKFALGAVQDATDVIPEARAQLLRRVQSKQLEVQTKKRLIEQNQIALAERQAAIEAQERLIDLASEQEKELEQLIDRVRALMEEGYHGNDDAFEEAEAVGEAAVDLQPGEGTSAAAVFTSEAAGQLNKAFRLRALRADKFLAVLYQVELSHVPFPDEPPVLWPPAPVWRALTERRKKWASVDLHKNSPAEEKIQAALIDPQGVEIEFIDTPLKEAMDFIADANGITIIMDEPALTEEGISIDEPINRILSGVTLRSALKIILEPLGLTYIIEDEVMKITTSLAAEDKLSTRVYPVGDLVVPILSGRMASMMLGGGMMGGMGGGMMGGMGGGMMGGMGGMGGMMGGMGGGMGMMGGGMGMMSIASPPIPQPQQNPAAKPVGQPGQQGQAAPRKRRSDPEVQNLLDRILEQGTSQTAPADFQPQWFAQIQDGGFRLDNKAVEALKKKAT